MNTHTWNWLFAVLVTICALAVLLSIETVGANRTPQASIGPFTMPREIIIPLREGPEVDVAACVYQDEKDWYVGLRFEF